MKRIFRSYLVLTLPVAILAASCAPVPQPSGLPPAGPTTQQARSGNFWISGPDSVAFRQFNVTAPGKVFVVAKWTGASPQLTLELQGRRRPSEPDPTAPYAVITGASPLKLVYDVTPQDFKRGVSWRAVLKDASGNRDATGDITIEVPVSPAREAAFKAQGVRLRAGDLWPNANLSSAFFTRLNSGATASLHGIVTLRQACTCQDNLRLERDGVLLLRHLPGRQAIARIDRRFTLATNPLVSSIALLDPEDKIDPDILVGNFARFVVSPDGSPLRNQVAAGAGLVNVTVTFFRDVAASRISQILTAEGVPFTRLSDIQWQITVPPVRLRPLAANDEVEAIDAGPAPALPDNDNSRAAINTNVLQNGTVNAAGTVITYAGATGQGVTVGVQDQGIDASHGDLNVVASLSEAADGSHGTHVAGTIAGSGLLSNGTNTAGGANGGTPFQWRGQAPNAGLIASGDLDTASVMLTAIQSNSLDLYNRSQSYGFDGNYDAENNRIDSLIHGGATDSGTRVPARLLVTSAGNHGNAPLNQRPAGGAAGTTLNSAGGTGYFSITKQLKNAIIVGNQSSLVTAAAVSLAGSSSLGPTYDGRIKPDVLALGTNILSTGTNGDGVCVPAGTNLSNGYVSCSGTSMASPAIAGGVAQLLELWQTSYNAPIGATLDANPPLPALMRALVIDTATDVVQADVRGAVSPDVDLDSNAANGNDGQGRIPATVGPDYATGWGTANFNAAATILTDTRTVRGRTLSDRMVQGIVSQGGTREYDFVVNQGGPVRVTLAWDDTEATSLNPATSPMLVNDLDLELVGPDGTLYYPWRLGHTITDPAGNALADAAQTPGTDIRVALPIQPVVGPLFQWQFVCSAGAPPGCPTTAQAVAPVNPDNVPFDAVDGNGANDVWVATTGKDHLNNVEQVLVNVPNNPAQFGHWKARVTGFSIKDNAQSFALVGFPYPALPDLVPSSTDRVAFATFGTPISFNWKVRNVSATGTGVGFTHQVLLSKDFALGNDVVLTDTTAAPFAALAGGAEASRTSTVTITQADAAALLGNPAATVDDLIASDAFLLVRADSGDAVLEHDDVNLLAIQLGRQVDVVTVYDRSGSMGASVPISGGSQTKIQQMQDSANLFVDLLRRDAGDRLGQVSFASSSSTDFSDGAGAVKSFGAADVAAAQTAISGLSASGQTNIRGALDTALNLIPASTDRRKVIIFFSDGMRTAGGDPNEASFLQRFANDNVKVFAVGFGTEGGEGLSGLDIGLLQNLANAGAGGFFHVTQSALELDKFFVNALANAVAADVIVDPVDSLAPGQTKEVPINVVGPDRIVTFVLTWDNAARRPIFDLVSPSGIVIGSGNAATFGDAVTRLDTATYALAQVKLPVGVGPNQLHAGPWKMRISNGTAGAVRFAASAITESDIVAATTIEPTADGVHDVGEPMTLTTFVQDAGKPVTDATVTVSAKFPIVSLGNALSAANITPAEFNAVPATVNGEPIGVIQRLTMALTRRQGHDPISYVTTQFTATAVPGKPGLYRGSMERTRATGPYTFTARAEALTKDCETFTREGVTSAYIPQKTDGRRTPVVVTTSRDQTFVVSFAPRDSGGGFVGPGLATSITVKATGAEPTSALVDRFDGSYEQTFRGLPGVAAARIAIDVDGQTLAPKTIAFGLPSVAAVSVTEGPNIQPIRTSIVLDPAGSAPAGGIKEVILVKDGVETRVNDLQWDQERRTIKLVVPAGLSPGGYDLLLSDGNGIGPASTPARFYVKASSGVGSTHLVTIEHALASLAATGDPTGQIRVSLLDAIQQVPLGPRVTDTIKNAALTETVALMAHDASPVNPSGMQAVSTLLATAKLDLGT